MAGDSSDVRSLDSDSREGGDLEGASPQDLTDAIGQLHGLECAVRRRLLSLIVGYDIREDWKADGATSMLDWVSRQLRLPRTRARQLLEVAHALEELPAIATAFEEGRLSWGQIVPLVRIATPDSDEGLAERAQGIDATQLEAAARRMRRVPREQVDDAHGRRFLSWGWSLDQSSLRLQGRLPADQGAAVVSALERKPTGASPYGRPLQQQGGAARGRAGRDGELEFGSRLGPGPSDRRRARRRRIPGVGYGAEPRDPGRPQPPLRRGPSPGLRLQAAGRRPRRHGAPLGVGRTT